MLQRLGADVPGHPRPASVRTDDEPRAAVQGGRQLAVLADDAGDPTVAGPQHAGRGQPRSERGAGLLRGVNEQTVEQVAARGDQEVDTGAVLDRRGSSRRPRCRRAPA